MDNKIILDLCGGTGSWSRPYKEAGYDVRLITKPLFDVREYEPPSNVYGILAAPPCTHFSFARTNAILPRDLAKGFEIVKACLDIIWACRVKDKLAFWALENPKGYLRQFLGKPFLEFDPYEYGDPWIKRTDLWGYFNLPRTNTVSIQEEERVKFTTNSAKLRPVEFHSLFNPNGYVRDYEMEVRQIKRAVTPPGFAHQFFKANR